MKKIFYGFTAIAFLVALAGCGPATVADKKVVKVGYTLKVDGAVFDQSQKDQPLEFMVGAGKMIPGFEKAIMGLKVGEKKSFVIKAVDAYGEYDKAKLIEVPLTQFPKENPPKAGMQFSIQTPQGAMPVSIAAVGPKTATVDLNGPLAGKDLSFDVEMVQIRNATKEELAALSKASPAASPTAAPTGSQDTQQTTPSTPQ